MLLFKQCHVCGLEVKLETSVRGTLLLVSGILCPDGHVLRWQSQPTIRGMAAGNFLLSAAILFCGLLSLVLLIWLMCSIWQYLVNGISLGCRKNICIL